MKNVSARKKKTTPSRVEFDRETDERWIAEIPKTPGAMSYGSTKQEASRKAKKTANTSWGRVAKWYDETVEEKSSYQQELILPNLLRLMEITRGERVLDLACGQGMFSRAFYAGGAEVIGVDVSKELVELGKKKSPPEISFQVAPADALPFLKNGSIDKVALVLALQNIEQLNETLAEAARVLVPNGKVYIVLNHPAFRIPKASSWGFSAEGGPASGGDHSKRRIVQYRRIDRYLSELKAEIDMSPGLNASRGRGGRGEITVSFHRPLQSYVKALFKNGFAIRRLEEWSSTKKSQKGPRAAAEDRARTEIPLFMGIEAQK